ncbi:MAG: hypothetical protein PWP09_1717, partial [Thermotogota bacterium]|nr:hypothetical protein [Thermotogota bacterium]
LGASQDLETEMCDEGRKGRRAPSACEGRVIACVLRSMKAKKPRLGDRLYECLLRRFARL